MELTEQLVLLGCIRIGLLTLLVKRSGHAILIRSAIAGLSSRNVPACPSSALAARIASLIAKKTEDPRNRGGSPIPCDDEKALQWRIQKLIKGGGVGRSSLSELVPRRFGRGGRGGGGCLGASFSRKL